MAATNPSSTEAGLREALAAILELPLKDVEANGYNTSKIIGIEDSLVPLFDRYSKQQILAGRIDETNKTLKALPALHKHSGDSWNRGYVSAQQTLRQKLKKRLTELKLLAQKGEE